MFLDRFRSLEGLHAQVRDSLSREFQGSLDCKLGDSAADVVVEQGDKVAVIEVKVGSPGFSLPSSTYSRFRFLSHEAEKHFHGKKILPILVTNYPVTLDEANQLGEVGVKLITLPNSSYNSSDVFATFRQIGFEPKTAETSPDGKVVA